MPEAMRQSLVEKSRAGPFPLSNVVDLRGFSETCTVQHVYLTQDEIHLFLKPRLLRWSEVRKLIDTEYLDPDSLTLVSHMIAIAKALWRPGKGVSKDAAHRPLGTT